MLVTPNWFKTYLAVINNSPGTKMFQEFYAEIDGKEQNIMKGGDVSCAYFVTGVLSMFNLIDEVKVTVHRTIDVMSAAGWKEVTQPRPGAVLVWAESQQAGSEVHKHIGFYIGDDKAISNRFEKGYPMKHHWTFGEVKGKAKREVLSIWWHESFTK